MPLQAQPTHDLIAPFEGAARIYCAKAGFDPDQEVSVPHPFFPDVMTVVPLWYGPAEELLNLSMMLTSLREAALEANANVTGLAPEKEQKMSDSALPAQGPVDVVVRPAAWAIRQRNPDESTDPWADIFCNPDTAREEAAGLEATSTERFDVVPMYTSVPPVITGTTEAILRDEASGYDPKGLCYVRAGLLLEAANLIAALASERDRFFEELTKVSAGKTARAATAKNVFAFPATTTMTPEQALWSALEFATNDNLQDVLVAGYDGDGGLLVRSSRMDRKEALWLSEQMRRYALGDVA